MKKNIQRKQRQNYISPNSQRYINALNNNTKKQNLSHKTRVIDVSVVDLEHKEVETGLHAHFKFGEHRQIR